MALTNIGEVEKSYEENFQKGREDVGRTIGLEQEYPLVTAGGRCTSFEDLTRLYETLGENGWKGKMDDQTEKLVAVTKEFDGQITQVSTDFGMGTLEINFPYKKTLDEVKDVHDRIMHEVLNATDRNGISILGYAVQPVSHPCKTLVVPKGRYNTLNSRFWTNDRLFGSEKFPQRTDVHYHTVNSAEQVHIQVKGKEEAIRAVNLLNMAAPILTAANANSPIWCGSKDPDYKEPRQLFWDWVVNVPQDKHRKGIAPYFKDMKNYLDTVMGFEPIMTMRQVEGVPRYLEYFGPKTFHDFLKNGSSLVILPGTADRKKWDTEGDWSGALKNMKVVSQGGKYCMKISPEPIDLMAQDGFVWYDARLKSEYGTVEVRSCGQQPPEDWEIVPALALGLVNNLDGLEALLGGFTTEDARQARISAAKLGVHGNYSHQGMKYMAEQICEVAKDGLRSRGLGEEDKLDKLAYRLDSVGTPADEDIRVYEKGGIPALIELRKYKEGHLS